MIKKTVHVYGSLVYFARGQKINEEAFLSKLENYLKKNFPVVVFGGQVELWDNLADFHFKTSKKLSEGDLNAVKAFLENKMNTSVAELNYHGSENLVSKTKLTAYNKFVSSFAKKQKKAGKKFNMKAAAQAWNEHKKN